MHSIIRGSVPEDALLKTYRGGAHPERWGSYGDCFSVPVDRTVSLVDFVVAFYTSSVFRIERLMLRALVAAPSRDCEARAVADGSGAYFSVWRVGARTPTQLLMCDRYERTRSWFRVVPLDLGKTLLQFGSSVASTPHRRTGAVTLGGGFHLLLGFHVLYSRVLLRAAQARVMKSNRKN
jgi:hypothetical protein